VPKALTKMEHSGGRADLEDDVRVGDVQHWPELQ
jgi:hypothetical protein